MTRPANILPTSVRTHIDGCVRGTDRVADRETMQLKYRRLRWSSVRPEPNEDDVAFFAFLFRAGRGAAQDSYLAGSFVKQA